MRNLILATIMAFVGLFGAANAENLLYKEVTIELGGQQSTWAYDEKQSKGGVRVYFNKDRPSAQGRYTLLGQQIRSSGGDEFSPHNGQTPPEGKWHVGAKWDHSYTTGGDSRSVECENKQEFQAQVRNLTISGVLRISCIDRSTSNPGWPKATVNLDQPPPEYGPYSLNYHFNRPPGPNWRPHSPATNAPDAGREIKYHVVGYGKPTPRVAQR